MKLSLLTVLLIPTLSSLAMGQGPDLPVRPQISTLEPPLPQPLIPPVPVDPPLAPVPVPTLAIPSTVPPQQLPGTQLPVPNYLAPQHRVPQQYVPPAVPSPNQGVEPIPAPPTPQFGIAPVPEPAPMGTRVTPQSPRGVRHYGTQMPGQPHSTYSQPSMHQSPVYAQPYLHTQPMNPVYGSPWGSYYEGMPVDGDGINPAGAEGIYVGPATAGGLHARHPYYSYRRPWYTPGPASLNVDIVW